MSNAWIYTKQTFKKRNYKTKTIHCCTDQEHSLTSTLFSSASLSYHTHASIAYPKIVDFPDIL